MTTNDVMELVEVRRLAAVDMHGAHGSVQRRRVILAEFVLGAVGGVAFGVWALTSWHGTVGVVAGIYLLGLAANYAALALHAITLSRAGALDAELRGIDIRAALRHYTATQFWVFVPGLDAGLAMLQHGRK
jgi:hypothetical protein